MVGVNLYWPPLVVCNIATNPRDNQGPNSGRIFALQCQRKFAQSKATMVYVTEFHCPFTPSPIPTLIPMISLVLPIHSILPSLSPPQGSSSGSNSNGLHYPLNNHEKASAAAAATEQRLQQRSKSSSAESGGTVVEARGEGQCADWSRETAVPIGQKTLRLVAGVSNASPRNLAAALSSMYAGSVGQ